VTLVKVPSISMYEMNFEVIAIANLNITMNKLVQNTNVDKVETKHLDLLKEKTNER
jgi:hypothetical protein